MVDRKWYELNRIYMATGPILLALIFFQNCGPIFSNETMGKYRTAGEKRRAWRCMVGTTRIRSLK